MKRTSPQDLTSDELRAWVLRLQERLEVLEVRDREQSQLIERQAKRMAELEQENRQLQQKNPTSGWTRRIHCERKSSGGKRLRGAASLRSRRDRNPRDAGGLIRLRSWRWPRGTRTFGRASMRTANAICGIRERCGGL